jgi:glutamate transport system permease protein
MTTPVLFDLPGPKARRRIRIGTAVGALVVGAIGALVLVRLAGNGQLEAQRWAVLFDPASQVPQALGLALLRTLQAAIVGMVLATLLGLLLVVGRLSEHNWIRVLVSTLIEFFRAVPLLVLIFALYFLLPKFGIRLSAFWALVSGLVLYNSAVLAEIFRAGILSVDRGQREAAYGLGMRKTQVMTLVLLPQAIRRMLPVLIAQLIVLLKDTSLGFIVAYAELLRRLQQNTQFFGQRYWFQFFVVGAAIYITVNFTISRVAVWLERRGTKKAAGGVAAADEAQIKGTHAPDTEL